MFKALLTGVTAWLLATGASAAYPQDNFPSRPVRMIGPLPPGQATVIVTRLLVARPAATLPHIKAGKIKPPAITCL